ncbi:hypothetical protein BX070DRAFT_236551 [Coemansia spiralis]|nr:hypothetical protein BX070DRAFT_236551 [Coemansia spiralis]
MQASLSIRYQPPRLHAEPIAELSGFVACNKPVRLSKQGSTVSLLRKPSLSPLHLTKNSSNIVSGSNNSISISSNHERTLEMLRTVLCSIKPLDSSCELEASIALHKEALEMQAPQKLVGLESHRASLIEALRELQHPGAETIASINALLCNRVKLGLLNATSAASYHVFSVQSIDADDVLTMPIGFVGKSIVSHTADSNNISSSLDSNGSSETLTEEDDDDDINGPATYAGDIDVLDACVAGSSDEPSAVISAKTGLIEMWASNGFWRGVSTRPWSASSSVRRSSTFSGSTLAEGTSDSVNDAYNNHGASVPSANVAVKALPDDMGICWPLDDVASEAASSWGRFYADLGGVRVPTRFRTPRHSLAMLATEQRMMCNDKIVCPLKNRLQEPNPRRQQFEDYIRETGTLPPPPPVSRNKPRSPLCSEI